THSIRGLGQADIFGNLPKPWVGWYEAIKDLIPDMQITELSKNQQLALKGLDLSQRLLVPTIGYRSKLPPVYSEHQPAPTVKAMMMSDGKSERRGCWKIIDNYKVREMSVRGLARLQGFPDDLILSGHKGLDCKCIGNAVPPLVMKKILEECFDGQ
ncbi:MAG: DNA cytosine methyltransferase, partial [Candidatus Nanopelagicaceae bacterium]